MANPKPVGSVGIGAAIGAPTGMTFKMYLADGMAMQFSVGGDVGKIGDVGLNFAVVKNITELDTPTGGYLLPIYVGGGIAGSSNLIEASRPQTFIGVQAVFGLLMTADGFPIEVYMESNPTLYILGQVPFSWGVDGQLGFRYFF